MNGELTPAIETVGLTKHYGDFRALIDLDLEVMGGEVFGFLGPNGAGKTTAIRGSTPISTSTSLPRRPGVVPGRRRAPPPDRSSDQTMPFACV